MLNTWMVRAGKNGYVFDRFRDLSVVGLGWQGPTSTTDLLNKVALLSKLEKAYPGAKKQSLFVAAGQLQRFAKDLKLGDRVVTYDPRARAFLCGTIAGDCKHFAEPEQPDCLIFRRAVTWNHEKSRDDISQVGRNSLGAILTLFAIPEKISHELWATLGTASAPSVELRDDNENLTDASPPPIVSEEYSIDHLNELAEERIKDRIARLDWSQMQELVAGLLRAMGYQTVVSAPGPDRGKDIVASPDGFGFQAPRIVVEVKHRPSQRMGPEAVRSFLGGRKPHECGLYVSTGGFTREALYEAERAAIPLALMDFEELVKSLLIHYPKFDDRTRLILPLAQFYWPA